MQTVDFFTPIVDDPYVYGQIAAANSLSDVYAMGGRPLTALAIAGFPKKGLPKDVIAQVFRGGFDKLVEAGVALLGGHTVQDPEMKFGYAVTGAVDPKRIWSNAGAREGDRLLLTKPLGTGVIGTAMKKGRAPAALAEQAVASMRTLNKAAAQALVATPLAVHSCTDITGFGLIGHASEVAMASGVTLHIRAAQVPLFDGVLALAPPTATPAWTPTASTSPRVCTWRSRCRRPCWTCCTTRRPRVACCSSSASPTRPRPCRPCARPACRRWRSATPGDPRATSSKSTEPAAPLST